MSKEITWGEAEDRWRRRIAPVMAAVREAGITVEELREMLDLIELGEISLELEEKTEET